MHASRSPAAPGARVRRALAAAAAVVLSASCTAIVGLNFDPTVCSGGKSPCSDACVDLSADAMNCGACGHACPEGTACRGGACGAVGGASSSSTATSASSTGAGGASASSSGAGGGTCQAPDTLLCASVCVDPDTDDANCGGCGNACVGGHHCKSGACKCTSGQNECGGVSGTCQTAVCQTCSNGQVLCGNSCVTSDDSHCGSACEVCGSQQTCGAAGCTCSGGLTTCGAACVDPMSDPDNCGSCGHQCTIGDTCVNGSCSCLGPVSMCSQSCGPSALSCGAACVVCLHGQLCDPTSPVQCVCDPGLTLCSGSCVNQNDDGQHCGGCDPVANVCVNGKVCVAGTCQDTTQCNQAGQTSCPSTRSCVNLDVDYFNCGTCGNVCGIGQVCVGAKCEQEFTSPACTGTCAGGCAACGSAHTCCDVSINGTMRAVCVQGTQCPGGTSSPRTPPRPW